MKTKRPIQHPQTYLSVFRVGIHLPTHIFNICSLAAHCSGNWGPQSPKRRGLWGRRDSYSRKTSSWQLCTKDSRTSLPRPARLNLAAVYILGLQHLQCSLVFPSGNTDSVVFIVPQGIFQGIPQGSFPKVYFTSLELS